MVMPRASMVPYASRQGLLAMLSSEPGATISGNDEALLPPLQPHSSVLVNIMMTTAAQGQRQGGTKGPRDDHCLSDRRLGCEMPLGYPGAPETWDGSAWGHHRLVGTGDPFAPQHRGPQPPLVGTGQRDSTGRGQILARHCQGLRSSEQWGGKMVTSNWCPGQPFHADAVLWVRKLLVSQEHRRQI